MLHRIAILLFLLHACCGEAFLTRNTPSSYLGLRISATTKREDGTQLQASSSSDNNNNNNDDDASACWSRRDVLSTATAAAAGGLSSGSSTFPIAPASAKAVVETTNAATTTTIAEGSNSGIPSIRLGSSDLMVSRSIQGYWQLAGGHGRYNEADAIANMQKHYDAGFTTLDTADIYGPSETIIGKFLAGQKAQSAVGSPPPIACTKLCCFRFLDEIDRTEVRQRILKSCERLQVDQLPLVQFFWSNYDNARYTTVGLYLAELQQEGLIRAIGATNFDLPRLQELQKAGVPIVNHQVQLSALDRRPLQSGMGEWCREHQISLTAYGTVGGGILSDRFLGQQAPPTMQERNTASLRMYSATAERFGDWKLVQELLQTMQAIATDVRNSGRCPTASIANVAQRYVLDASSTTSSSSKSAPTVASLVIGVRNPAHVAENVATHSFVLTEAEVHAMNVVVDKRQGPQGDVWTIERSTFKS